jgi:hypothetical protein
VQVVPGLDLPSDIRARGGEVPYALRQPLFRNMHQIDSSRQVCSNVTEQNADYKTLFEAARSLAGCLLSFFFHVMYHDRIFMHNIIFIVYWLANLEQI